MIKLNFFSQSKNWPRRLKKVKKISKKVLKEKNTLNFHNNTNYYLNIILINDKEMKKLNTKYKKKNKTTDVLTFVSTINKKDNCIKFCDIFFSAETINKDSKINKVDFYDHFTHLLVHSFLHINGFLHKKIIDFNKMKKNEILILKKIGLSNPYN
tara:strand:+ start:278 stop:742 length:465 start_codon:yes stop_codon:yes gene_type:complete